LPEVPQHWQDIFTTSADVAVDQHIDMLAAFQKYTCNAVSKTINAPNNDTMENVARSIIRAYKKGCKGFTYYRDGSRTEQVVTFSREGDIKGGNRDIAARAETDSTATAGAAAAAATPTHSIEATTESLEELDIEELLAKANALLEAH
jgi:ribonucleotide reductase alpha subunit